MPSVDRWVVLNQLYSTSTAKLGEK